MCYICNLSTVVEHCINTSCVAGAISGGVAGPSTGEHVLDCHHMAWQFIRSTPCVSVVLAMVMYSDDEQLVMVMYGYILMVRLLYSANLKLVRVMYTVTVVLLFSLVLASLLLLMQGFAHTTSNPAGI
jgi:hypothetical protein